MPISHKAARPLARCLQASQSTSRSARAIRTFTSTSRPNNQVTTETTSFTPNFDPTTVTSRKGERELMKSGVMPIGSRRRRAAIKSSENIPFEQLPFQCFQEARKVLLADREEKLKLIATERLRISNLTALDAASLKGGGAEKTKRLNSMQKHLEYLKIQADINDPLIKKRFEDGDGDMNKPIYRYLADRKWRQYQRLIIVQRIHQLGVVPDALSFFEPTADVRLAFRNRNVQPGEFIDSRVSEVPARLRVQVFDKGERLISVVVIDGDVPLVESDNFTSRCHYLAANIPVSPNQTSVPLSHAKEDQLVLPWLPPFAQKGSPYHRYVVFVIQQQPGQVLDVSELQKKFQRDGFSLRKYCQGTYGHSNRMEPIGVNLFRAEWDEGTAGVMERAGIEGADIEFKRKRIEPLKQKEKARGWEARHAGPKYASLRKGRPLGRRMKTSKR